MFIDEPNYDQLISAATKADAARIFSIGRKTDAEFSLLEPHQHVEGMTVHAEMSQRELGSELRMHGSHWSQNAPRFLGWIDALSLSVDEAAPRLDSCPPLNERGGRLSGRYQDCKVTLIYDNYNASPG